MPRVAVTTSGRLRARGEVVPDAQPGPALGHPDPLHAGSLGRGSDTTEVNYAHRPCGSHRPRAGGRAAAGRVRQRGPGGGAGPVDPSGDANPYPMATPTRTPPTRTPPTRPRRPGPRRPGPRPGHRRGALPVRGRGDGAWTSSASTSHRTTVTDDDTAPGLRVLPAQREKAAERPVSVLASAAAAQAEAIRLTGPVANPVDSVGRRRHGRDHR